MRSDLWPILDEEINRLPTKYRSPVLLCYLQGVSCEEAAQRLGCAKGTVFSRLARARNLLRRRLLRRGLDVSAGALAAVLVENETLRAVPPLALREITVRTGLLFAAGTAGQSLPAPLAALVEGVVRSMFFNKVKAAVIVVLALGMVGSGLGSLAHYTDASSPALSPLSVKDDNHQPNAPAPENAKLAAPAPAKGKLPAPVNNPNKLVTRRDELREQLNQVVDYPGLEDARATLTDVLDQLSKRYNLTFSINNNAFRAIDPKNDVARFEIATTPIPEMRANLKTVIHTILDRLPEKMGAMYLIRNDRIEIITQTAFRAELGIPANRPLLPLVWDTVDNIPIAEALRHLADHSGYNVVADPRVVDKIKTPVSAEFNNVPVDTAVRLLANMAGLNMVRLDNVFYVTTAENAKQLREEQAKINADTAPKNAEVSKKSASDKDKK